MMLQKEHLGITDDNPPHTGAHYFQGMPLFNGHPFSTFLELFSLQNHKWLQCFLFCIFGTKLLLLDRVRLNFLLTSVL